MAAVQNPQPDEKPVLNTTQARQGRRGRHALWVLVISFGLIAVIYGVMVLGVQGSRLSTPGGQTRAGEQALQQSGGFQAPAPEARQTERSPTLSPSVPPAPTKDQTPVSR